MHKAIEEGSLGSCWRKFDFKILYRSITLVLELNQSTEFFFLQVERTFFVRHVNQNLVFLTHFDRILLNSKYIHGK